MNVELLGHIKTLVQDAKKAAETIGKKMEKNYAKRDSFLKINKWLSDLLKRIAEAAGANLSIDYGLILGIAQSSAIPLQAAFKLLTKGAGPSSSELKKIDERLIKAEMIETAHAVFLVEAMRAKAALPDKARHHHGILFFGGQCGVILKRTPKGMTEAKLFEFAAKRGLQRGLLVQKTLKTGSHTCCAVIQKVKI